MRWLLETTVRLQQLNQTAAAAAASPPASGGVPAAQSSPTSDSFDANMVIILAALLCALILALGLNSILRCALRCSNASPLPLSSTSKVPRGGLKKGALRKLPVAVYGASDGAAPITATECPICLGDFEDGDQVRALPGCGHAFHARCVDAWLVSNSSCPTCRRSLLAPERDSGAKRPRVAPAAADPEPRMGYRVRAFFMPTVVISPPPPMV